MQETNKSSRKKIAIIGAGLAGMAAAVKLLTEYGDLVEVSLFEQSRFMGGRVSSFQEKVSGKLLDSVQHVSMRCCKATMNFLDRTGLKPLGRFQKEIVFAFPRKKENILICDDTPNPPSYFLHKKFINQIIRSGDAHIFSSRPRATNIKFSIMRNSHFFPYPLHLTGSVLRLHFLPFRQRIKLLNILRLLQKTDPPTHATFRDWLNEMGCPESLQHLFWDVLVLSAFSEKSEHVSAKIAKKVFSTTFFTGADAWHVWLPSRPLRMIFHDKMLEFFRHFSSFHFHPLTQIKRISPHENGTFSLVTRQEEYRNFDACILTVPWKNAAKILPELVQKNVLHPEAYESRAISAVHAWYDRPLFSPWRNVAIPGMTIQWIFRHAWGDADFPLSDPLFSEENKNLSDSQKNLPSQHGYYHQLMLSDSDTFSSHPDILQQKILEEMQQLFPQRKLIHAKTVRIPSAVFSPNIHLENIRPVSATPWPNIFLAGDWISTDLPATMEGAILSGEMAVKEMFLRE
ncbi:MAG: FAD-dependent oxidoreductase [Planctomycetia bacterium]|nr:FAD-dependent oxidoreductase [Planctomycetia bacterium]